MPFHGAPCSDASGAQKDYADITQVLREATTAIITNNSNSTVKAVRKWDVMSQTPYLVVQEADGNTSQYWYDDVESLSKKFSLAKELQLRGVGMWHADSLHYVQQPQESKEMWDAMRIVSEGG